MYREKYFHQRVAFKLENYPKNLAWSFFESCGNIKIKAVKMWKNIKENYTKTEYYLKNYFYWNEKLFIHREKIAVVDHN